MGTYGDIEKLREKLASYGQVHLLDFWSTLSSDADRQRLYAEIDTLNLADINKWFKNCSVELNQQSAATSSVDDRLSPLPDDVVGSVVRTDVETLRGYEDEGLKQIARGKVAVLLLAGGQGTRLGVTYPKGMYDVGLPSHKTLYHLQAQRIIKVQELARQRHPSVRDGSGIVPWYIMTSEQTRAPTEKFFANHNNFGLDPENIIFFEQSTIPCLDFDGKIILETPSSIAKAPDGNGGLYSALQRHHILDDIISRGIEYLHVYCVDNILVKMADPVFIGYCIAKGAGCGVKVVEKTSPTEPVGVVCRLDGKYHVVEYSEISMSTAEKRDASGKLLYNAGGIANHFFTVDLMKTIVREKESTLCHHVAKKKIPYCDKNGELVRPSQINGIKLEKFVFDIFQFATDCFAVWEVLRDEEFSPLKNADSAGKDTPTTSREALLDLHHRWVLKAGGHFVRSDGSPISDIPSNKQNNNNIKNGSRTGDSEGEVDVICEISPLVSYNGEGLEERVKGKSLTPPICMLTDKEKTPLIA